MSKLGYILQMLRCKFLLFLCYIAAFIETCTLSYFMTSFLFPFTWKLLALKEENFNQLDFLKAIVLYLFIMFLSIMGAIFKIDAFKKEIEYYKNKINKMIETVKELYGNSGIK